MSPDNCQYLASMTLNLSTLCPLSAHKASRIGQIMFCGDKT